MWEVPIKYYSEWEQKNKELNTASMQLDDGKDYTVTLPTAPALFYGNPYAAGIDIPFFDPEVEEVVVLPGQRAVLKTGVYLEMPETVFGFLDSRSSTSKLLLDLLCRTIDPDYRGNIRLSFTNVGEDAVTIKRGEYLFQLILLPRIKGNLQSVDSVDQLSETVRGINGFGFTGNSQVADGTAEVEEA
jgi:dUTP pyrophosphatase